MSAASPPASSESPTSSPQVSGQASAKQRGPWRDAWMRMRRNRLSVVSAWVVVFIVLFSVFGPIIVEQVWGYTYSSRDVAYGPHGPSAEHWFGTDSLGRDLLVRVMIGGRIALLVGLVSTMIATAIGVMYGAISGFAGKRTDNAMMRAVDVLYAMPFLVLVIAIQATIASKTQNPWSKLMLMFALLGAIGWLTIARIVRGQVLALKHREFVEAARALGVPWQRILFRHIVPNTAGPVIIYATASIPAVMLEEAFLSYLGLGIQPPLSSWGVLLSEGQNQMTTYPWMLIFPAITMAVTVLALNFLGDGLRDALDPQTRKIG